MNIKFLASKFSLLAVLALSGNSYGSQIQCPQGSTPVAASTGFFEIGRKLSCPNHDVRCVDFARCPQADVPECPAGSIFQSIVSGFSDIGVNDLACPVYSGGCVKIEKCPALAPLNCRVGSPEAKVVGFRNIDRQLSCPVVEMACVDIKSCPQY
jgi:hypothetical protein